MRLKFVLGAVLVLVLHAVCSQGQFEPSNNDNLDVVANSVTNLAQKISRAIASSKSKTEIFSPVSIAGALSLLLLGSSGVTRDELTKLMGFDSQINFAEIHKSFGKLFRELVSPEPSLNTPVPWRQNDKCNNYDYEDDEPSPPPKKQAGRGKRDTRTHQISVANGVFVDQNFQLGARYERLTKCLYQGSAQRLPFFVDPLQTAQRINGWAQQSTNGKIREIVTPDQVQRAPMVLASALYFKGKWETMFVEPDTRPRPFYVNGRNRAPVNVTSMATSGCFPYIDVKNWDAKIVGLPYQEGLSTMYLVVPNNSDRQKLQTFMDNVTINQLNRTIDQMEVKTGAVVMPKMQLENNLELKQVLSTMGLSTLFDPYKSNLSAIITTINDQDGDIEKACIHDNNPGVIMRDQTVTTTSRPAFVFQDNNVNTAEPNRRVMTPFQQPNSVIIPVTTKQDCKFIRNCIHGNNNCRCTIDSIDAEDQEYCPWKPFYVSHNCTNVVFSTEVWRVCLSNQFDLSIQENKATCEANGCTFFENQCYCCKNARYKTTTMSPFQNHYPQSPTLKQQQQQNHQIASRIEIDDRDQNQRHPSSNAPNLNYNRYQPTETARPQQGQGYAEHRQDSKYSQHNIHQQAQLHTVQDPVNTKNYQTANPTRSQPKPTYIEQRQDSHNNQHNVQQQYTPKPHQVPVINSYNQNNPPAPVTCNYVTECDWLHPCRYVYRCHPIPYHEPRRSKRQANRSPLFVGDIVHKVSLDIDESGTEGGAVTAVVIDRISSSFTLRLDGPFLIYLRHDNTKLPLFYGPVYDPRD